MTFRVANNQIHIGWPEMRIFILGLIGFISALATAVWSIRAGYDDFLKDKQETNTRLARIERQLTIKNNIDSSQTEGLHNLGDGQKALLLKFDSLGNSFLAHPQLKKRITASGIRFYTEKWINGQLVLTEVKQD
ncbi:hypothetical protein J3L18_30935 [Mucilaginibacter gossypii]|uniref:hypothetical protein n=1 Tax=Mucilaginibacter gossypii TaxID=551996 RepID=UPI000DCB0351|nr:MULTISPECIES: hypothetical protein [Mucilaginibacter]QTE37463.1 hypothetical protein J3L18_30935 [Mucilaginibacter gossypii]RAV47478.1 hypothetical protein DIU36_29460 [Mucilaginibacter rubeus]